MKHYPFRKEISFLGFFLLNAKNSNAIYFNMLSRNALRGYMSIRDQFNVMVGTGRK